MVGSLGVRPPTSVLLQSTVGAGIGDGLVRAATFVPTVVTALGAVVELTPTDRDGVFVGVGLVRAATFVTAGVVALGAVVRMTVAARAGVSVGTGPLGAVPHADRMMNRSAIRLRGNDFNRVKKGMWMSYFIGQMFLFLPHFAAFRNKFRACHAPFSIDLAEAKIK